MPDKPVIRVKDLKTYLEKFGDQAVVVRSKADQTHEGAYLVLDIAMDHLEQEHEGRA